MAFLLSNTDPSTKLMIFVDGENLAIRFGDLLGEQEKPEHVSFKKIFMFGHVF